MEISRRLRRLRPKEKGPPCSQSSSSLSSFRRPFYHHHQLRQTLGDLGDIHVQRRQRQWRRRLRTLGWWEDTKKYFHRSYFFLKLFYYGSNRANKHTWRMKIIWTRESLTPSLTIYNSHDSITFGVFPSYGPSIRTFYSRTWIRETFPKLCSRRIP